MDDGPAPPNPWRGYQICLSDLPDCSHALIIQDDAVVCKNFGGAVSSAIEAKPDNIISLFVGGLRNRTTRDFNLALATNKRFCEVYFRDIVHVVALIWPKHLAKALLDWVAVTKVPGLREPYRSDDAVVGAWMRFTHQKIYATVPCLVEHPDDQVSTIGRRASAGKDRGRVAINFMGEQDPLELDWN